ncbi:fatty acid synthase alpha subunit Lsd1, partial [Coemansia sp. Benny D115]
MLVPVRAPDGKTADIRSKGGDLTRAIAEYIYVKPVDWPATLSSTDMTHVIDMSSSGGIGSASLSQMSASILQGRGVSLIATDRFVVSQNSIPTDGMWCDLYTLPDELQAKHPVSWKDEYGPRLLSLNAPNVDLDCNSDTEQQLCVDSKLSRLLNGLPAVFVGGMAPITSDVGLVAAVGSAGYLAELAVDSIQTPQELVQSILKLVAEQPAGHPISLSGCCWSDAEKWKWQLATVAMLRQQGVPIIGVGVEDGVVPDPQCADLCDYTQSVGLRYLALRPFTLAQIHQVLEIAHRFPDMPIVLQWMGGRSGGRHSYEEFHLPILACYAAIRNCRNVTLVAGSGFGDAQGISPYMSGAWSIGCGAQAAMPFDGAMMRSRIMVASESPVVSGIKSLVAKAPGIDAYDIERLHIADSAAGVVSILDESGRPMHVLSTRAAMLCRDLSDTVFKHPRDKQLALLQARKPEIIRRLNADYMRPWFGKKADREGNSDSSPIVELHDMTYAEVLDRLLELLYSKQLKKWVHKGSRSLITKFCLRSASRMHSGETKVDQPIPLTTDYDMILDEIQRIKADYPQMFTQLLTSDDVQYFLWLCTRAEQIAPVPFIPVLDERFAWYMLRGSIMQCTDLDAVPDQDPQRLLIPQGPVAAAYSKEIDQPVGHILGSIYNGVSKALLDELYQGDLGLAATGTGSEKHAPSITTRDSQQELAALGIESSSEDLDDGCIRFIQLPDSTSDNSADVPLDIHAWARLVSDGSKGWLSALITADFIVQGRRCIGNYVARMMRPRYGSLARIIFSSSGDLASVDIGDSCCSCDEEYKEIKAVFDSSTGRIALTLQSSERVLALHFWYRPSTPWAPIHEVMDGRDGRIADFLLPSTGDSFDIKADAVSAFCRSCNIDLPGYLPNTDGATDVPLDYLTAIIAQQCALKAIASDPLASEGLLAIVLASSSAELVETGMPPARHPPKIGDSVDCKARIIEISQGGRGHKQTVVLVSVYRQTTHVADVTYTFEYPGVSIGDRGFRHTDEPQMIVKFQTAENVAVLESKPWFVYTKSATPVAPGDRLVFKLKSQYTLLPEGAYSNAQTSGSVYLRLSVHELKHIADVDYSEGLSYGNPVISFLHEMIDRIEPDYSSPLKLVDVPVVCPLAGGEYSITSAPLSLSAPAQISQELATCASIFSAEHTCAYVADLRLTPAATLPSHWIIAATRALVERHAADCNPSRVVKFTANVSSAVYANDKLQVQLDHTGMCDGDQIIRGRVYRLQDKSDVVLECTATVQAPRTMYVFTGQGSQEPGMGMDLYASSHVVRNIYDRADRYMRDKFGFSILEIMRDNPKEYTVYFGGKKGAKIRNYYREFQFHQPKDNSEETELVPLFPEVTPTSQSYTFRSPNGLLNATQFAQPAIMIFDVAVAADMRHHGLIRANSIVAGHSLGEYGALTSFGIVSLEDIIGITFIRGMTMQCTVTRDAENFSGFAMVAANPARIAKSFTEESLAFVIEGICAKYPGKLLEIVNYNVRGYQYVLSGTRPMLCVLSTVLDKLHSMSLKFGGRQWHAAALNVIAETDMPGLDECRVLKRGRATIPIPGIDVPFHSSHLIAGAKHFRSCIYMMVSATDIDTAILKNNYIPNLNAQPFQITREYFTSVYEQTQSAVIAHELSKWPADEEAAFEADKAERRRLAWLMVVELLSYQFASPVKWIETQDRAFNELGVERFVEIGVSATLCRMAEGTLKLADRDCSISVLHMPRDANVIYYRSAKLARELEEQARQEASASTSDTVSDTASVASETPSTATATSTHPPLPASPASPELPAASSPASVGIVEDVPLTAVDVMRVVVAQKTHRPLADIQASATLRDLTGGKSTLLNEILGDLLKEFGISAGQSIPDRIDEISISEVCAGLGLTQRLDGMGRYTSGQVARVFSAKMPGNVSVSAARRHMADVYGLSRSHQQDAALLVSLTMEPEARLDSKDGANAWLAAVVRAYAQYAGITLVDATGPAAASTGGGSGAVINSAEFDEAQSKLRRMAENHIQTYAEYLRTEEDSPPAHESTHTLEQQHLKATQELDAITAELGAEFVEGIRGVFSSRKARRFDSYWNWARQDAISWVNSVSATREPVDWADSVNKQRLHRLVNRADSSLVKLLDGLVTVQNASSCKEAADLALCIRDRCLEALGTGRSSSSNKPTYREMSSTSHPVTEISTVGKISYTEVSPRPGEPTFADYVNHVSAEHD